MGIYPSKFDIKVTNLWDVGCCVVSCAPCVLSMQYARAHRWNHGEKRLLMHCQHLPAWPQQAMLLLAL
jgi:hypothetical protein